MKKLIILLALAAPLAAQSNGKNYSVSANGRSYGSAAYDTANFVAGSSNVHYTGSIVVPSGNANPLIMWETYTNDTGSHTVQSLSIGTNGYCFIGGTLVAGNSNFKNSQSNYCIVLIPGTIVPTVTLTGAPSATSGAMEYAVHNANPQTPLTGFAGATSGAITLTTTAGALGTWMDVDTNSDRTVTSTCTNPANTADFHAFGTIGESSAHGSKITSCPFTASAYNAGGSIATAVVVNPQ